MIALTGGRLQGTGGGDAGEVHHRGHRLPQRATESRWLSGLPQRHEGTTIFNPEHTGFKTKKDIGTGHGVAKATPRTGES